MEVTLGTRRTSLELANWLRRRLAPMEVAPTRELTRGMARGQTFTVEDPANLRVGCVAGTLGVTHDGGPKYVVIEAGEASLAERTSRMVVQALTDASLRITAAG